MAEIKNHLRQLGSESLVYGLSGVLSRFVSFFLVPIYTRIFSPEDYGVMTLVSEVEVVLVDLARLAGTSGGDHGPTAEELARGTGPVVPGVEQGAAVTFPATRNFLHGVRPVTYGHRYALLVRLNVAQSVSGDGV